MIISGKELAAKLKAEMAEQVKTFPEKYGRVPHLVVILVGNDPGSQTYVRNKERACEVVGFKHTTYRLPEETSEKEVLDAIQKVRKNRTVLMIAHRLAAVQKADVILVMNQGRIVEYGNHEQLMKRNGMYAAMYREQEGAGHA